MVAQAVLPAFFRQGMMSILKGNMMRLKVCVLLAAAVAVGLFIAAELPAAPAQSGSQATKSTAPTQAAFDKAVKPLFDSTCSMCHAAGTASGGLNFEQYMTVASLTSDRDVWDKIVHRL